MDKMSGKGRIEFASGAVYDGYWKDNQYQGPGTYIFPSQAKLSGEWTDNCVTGNCVYQDDQFQVWSGDISKGTASILIPFLE
jgi:hypothetical protein